MSPYVRHMVGPVFRSVGRVSKVSEHLLFLNIINVEERCQAIFRNNQLPFCASNSLLLLIASLGWELVFVYKFLALISKVLRFFLTDIKTRTFSRLAIDFEFQSKIVRNWSLPVAGNRYPLPGFRNGVPCFLNWIPCFHNGISGFSKICPSVWILVLKTILWISGHF